MSIHDGRRSPAFTRLAGSMMLYVALCGGAAFAAQPPSAGTDRTVSVAARHPGATEGDAPAVASDARHDGMRLAGSLGTSVGVASAPYARHDGDYCSQPGFCYPETQVWQQPVARRIQHRATTIERVAGRPQKVRATKKVRSAKAATPKRSLVRSVAAVPEPLAGTSAPYGFTPSSRDRAPALAGDSTGGARVTPTLRTVPGGGGGGGGAPGTVGDRTGGGRAVPTFRTVPSGRR